MRFMLKVTGKIKTIKLAELMVANGLEMGFWRLAIYDKNNVKYMPDNAFVVLA